MSDSLNHARHNQALAEKLFQEDQYLDWVITVAYYSCNHFLRYHLFPLKKHNIASLHSDVNDINEYCNYLSIKDKHGAICDLFVERHKDLSNLLLLKNDCDTARYINYNVRPQQAQRAMNVLSAVADRCKEKYIPVIGNIKLRSRKKKN